jgi:cytochrome c oxidase subunit 4
MEHSASAPAPRYLLVWGALAVLTAVEVGIAFIGLPRKMTIAVLVALAIWKAMLVALYFMHLRYEPNGVRILAIAPILPAILLVVIIMMEF